MVGLGPILYAGVGQKGANAILVGASGSVVECLTRDRRLGFKPHLRHCVVVLEQDTFILA